MNKKKWQKLKHLEKEKRSREIKIKGLSIKQITQVLLECESSTLISTPT